MLYGDIGRVDNNFMIPERDISPIKNKLKNTPLDDDPPNRHIGNDIHKRYLNGAQDSKRNKKKHSIDISEDSDGDLEIEQFI